MRTLCAVGLLVLLVLVASPAMALTQDEAQSMVASSGCTAPVRMVEYPFTGLNAYYNMRDHEVVLINFDSAPELWQRLIVYHETWHCRQVTKYGLPGGHNTEWDADAYAIKRLGEEGIDGAELNAVVWSTIYRRSGREGDDDDSHGLFVERIIRGLLNRTVYRAEA